MDLELVWQSLPILFHGAWVSLQIAIVASFIGFIFGTILAFGEMAKMPFLKWISSGYVILFRGTPMLIQILFVFYVLPQIGIKISPFWSASLAIGLNSSAYISQIIRSGINTVAKGQIEAAFTLGLSRIQTMSYIVLPQAFKAVIPSLGNELVTLIKDSSLASIIGVMELSKEASIIRSHTYDAFSILFTVACIYLIMTVTLSICIKQIETRVIQHV